jgi:Na+-driven multidrug efflux pump
MNRTASHSAGIVRLAVPMMSASLAVAIAQVLAMGVLGHLGHDALYVRAVYTPIVFAFLALGEALSASTQVVAAVSHGQGDERAGLAAVVGLLALGLIASGLLAGVCWLLAPELPRFVDSPPSAAAGLRSFARWMPAASVIVVIPLTASATLRGFGRARAAAAVTVTYVAVDLATVAIVAFGLDGGVLSLAWASAVGAVVAAALGAILLVRTGVWRPGRGPARIPVLPGASLEGMRRPLAMLRDVGLPILFSYGALFAFGLLVIRILRQFGPDVVSGFSVAYSIQTLAIVPAIALGSASAIFTNRLRGAGQVSEAATAYAVTLRLAARIYVGVAALVTALCLVLPPLISSSAAVAGAARTYLLVCGPALAALGVVLVTLTVLEQTGAGRLAVALNVINVAIVALVGGALAHLFGTPVGLYATIALASAAGLPAVVALARRHMTRLDGVSETVTSCLEPISNENRPEVHDLFCSPDFLFKTQVPALADPVEIDALLTDDTRAVTSEGAVLGLVELEPADIQAGHYRIHYRLRDELPIARWSTVLEEIIASERDERHILRLTFLVHESDQRGLTLAERCGLEYEGTLPSTVQRAGRRESTRFYARRYLPDVAPVARSIGEGALL